MGVLFNIRVSKRDRLTMGLGLGLRLRLAAFSLHVVHKRYHLLWPRVVPITGWGRGKGMKRLGKRQRYEKAGEEAKV